MRRFRTIILAGAVVLPIVVGAFVVQQRSARDGAQLFDQVLSLVSERFVDTVNAPMLYEKAARGLVSQLNDPYSELFSPKEMEQFSAQANGNYGGVGMQIEPQEDHITVVRVFSHTPAEAAGVQPGDRIIAVDSASTRGWSSQRVSNTIIGAVGTPVTVTFARPGVTEPIVHRFIRAEIHVPAVPYALMLEPKIAYIPIQTFNETAAAEMEKAVDRLRGEGASAIIIDLRNNPGGVLDQALGTAQFFLRPGQTIASVRGRGDIHQTFEAQGQEHLTDIPLVVLVDGYSASASEIVAGALQDHDRALIVGTTSFGKGLVQSLFRLDSGWTLKLTTAQWYTPSGRSIQNAKKWHPSLTAEGEEPAPVNPDTGGPDSTEKNAVKQTRPVFHSDAGRLVYGGGGITPDVIVSADTLTMAEQNFLRTIAPKSGVWRGALYDYALQLKGTVTSPNFTVSPTWRENLYRRLTKAGLSVSRAQYDSASSFVDRALGDQVAQLAFGDSTAFRRDMPDDPQLQRAIELLKKGRTQKALFSLAQAEPKKEQ